MAWLQLVPGKSQLQGLRANHAGEHVANVRKIYVEAEPTTGEVLHMWSHDRWVPMFNIRVGKPARLMTQPSTVLVREGWVGLYLRFSQPPLEDEVRRDGTRYIQVVTCDDLHEAVVSGEREAAHPCVVSEPWDRMPVHLFRGV